MSIAADDSGLVHRPGPRILQVDSIVDFAELRLRLTTNSILLPVTNTCAPPTVSPLSPFVNLSGISLASLRVSRDVSLYLLHTSTSRAWRHGEKLPSFHLKAQPGVSVPMVYLIARGNSQMRRRDDCHLSETGA